VASGTPSLSEGLLPNDGTDLYIVDHEAILHSERAHKLYFLNTSATFLWICLENGLSIDEAAGKVAAQFGISEEQALSDAKSALTGWRAEGLLSQAHSETAAATRHNPVQIAAPPVPSGQSYVPRNGPTSPPHGESRGRFDAIAVDLADSLEETAHAYRLGDLRLLIRYPSDSIRSIVHAVLAHLEDSTSPPGDYRSTRLDIVEHDNHLWLTQDSGRRSGPFTSEQIVPYIHQLMLWMAYENSGCLAAFHAGAVGRAGRCILLPGAGGAGKSTLIGALTATGFDYLTDELVLLMPEGDVSPMPISPALKKGAWDLLSQEYPMLRAAPTHLQPDGTAVRYLAPGSSEDERPLRYEVSAVVFPKYRAGSPSQLEPISRARALVELAASGYAVPNDLDAGTVGELVKWVRLQRACYRLQFGALRDAVELLHNLPA
jgi:hypothetical protein